MQAVLGGGDDPGLAVTAERDGAVAGGGRGAGETVPGGGARPGPDGLVIT